MSRFRLGIVGAGKIARSSHVPAALASPKVDLAALVDPATDNAKAIVDRYGLRTRVAADLEDVAADLDGVVIAVPNHLHRPLAERALAAGLAVLIEKPLATTVADGEAIVAAADRAGLTAAVGYHSRLWDGVALMKSLLARGYFGQLRRFVFQLGSRGGWAPLSAYNLDRAQTGGGVLVVSGTHFLDRALHWWGFPSELAYQDDSLGGPEANALCSFTFTTNDGTFHGTARFSKSVSLPGGLVLETDRGLVILREGEREPLIFRPADASDLEVQLRTRQRRDPRESPQRQIEDFVRSCRAGSPPACSAAEALQSLQLIEALYAHRTPLRDTIVADAQVEAE